MRLLLFFRGLSAFLPALTLLLAPAPAAAALGDWWPFGKSEAQETIPDPVEYSPVIMVIGPGADIEKALRNASNLVDRKSTPASGLAGLVARARQDIGDLTAVLYQNAYYGAEIAISIDGKPLETISPFDPIMTRPVPVDVRVTTGPRFLFGRIQPLPMPGKLTLERLGLVPGRPANSAVIVNAESAIADAWREQGHPLATVRPREVVADHETDTLDVALHVDAGPVARFGRVEVTGQTSLDPALVVGRAKLGNGPYSSTITKNATKRLRDLNVFDAVRITPADALDPDGTIPMKIAVTERKPHVIGGSVFYSNIDGAGVEGYWRHRNLFGGAEQFEIKGAVSRTGLRGNDLDYRLGTTLKKPGIFDPLNDGILRVEAYRQTVDAYRVTAFENEATLSRIFSETLTASAGVELARSRTEDTITGTADHLLLTLRGKLDWDTRDNRLDPVSGWRNILTLAPAHDFHNPVSFMTLGADVATYRAFGAFERTVLAGRIAVQSLIADNVLDVPADRRIYAGGAGSVRGYAYRSIAPRNENGEIIGGRSSLVVSGEVRYRINDQFGVVAFADVGNATASTTPSFSEQKVGLGLGLRYLTPVGPIRFDVAVPMQPGPDDPRVGLYVGLGQAF